MAGSCPAPACSPSCTARPALRRPRLPSPPPRRPLLASGLPAAASHTRMPPAAAAASEQQAGRRERGVPSGGRAEPGVLWRPRLRRRLRPSPRPARHAGKRARPRPRPAPWSRAAGAGVGRGCVSLEPAGGLRSNRRPRAVSAALAVCPTSFSAASGGKSLIHALTLFLKPFNFSKFKSFLGLFNELKMQLYFACVLITAHVLIFPYTKLWYLC